jgi:TRAP-type C4-dicarboxylate transport system substrate-binding protein
MKPIELNYAIMFPATHKQGVLATEWANEVGKRTNGRIKITMFSVGTLVPTPKIYDSVVSGIADIGEGAMSYTAGKFPLTEVTDLPWGYKNSLVATKLVNEYYKKFRPKEFDEVKVLYLHGTGPGIFHTKMAIGSLGDMKGRKIRGSAVNARLIECLGATAVNMPVGEAYDAGNRGVIEGVLLPAEALEGWKLGEVFHFTTASYSVATGQHLFAVMNKAKWNALPPDIQQIIEKMDEEWIEKTGRLWDELDRTALEFTQKLGGKIITLSKGESDRWVKAAQPIINDYLKDTKAKGLPAEEVVKFYRDYLKKNQ